MLMLRPLAITRQSDPGEEAAELRRKGWQHRGQQAQLWGARGLDSREKSFIFKEFRPKAKKKFQLVCRPQMSMWDQGEKLWMDDQHLTRCT